MTAYISTMRQGYSVHSVDEYRSLKKTMALYGKYECKFDEETLTKIATEIGKSIKDTKEMIRSGHRQYPLYRLLPPLCR